MNIQEKKYELIKFEDGDFSLDVSVSPEEDTVWLTQEQMAILFNRDTSVISRHISNILKEKECDESNLQKMQIPFSDKPITIYDLNMILSVGYRVKSSRGNQFRKWANSILKQYLLKGYVINEERCLSCTSNIISLQNKMNSIESKIKDIEESIYKEKSKAFFEGEIVESYTFIRHIFFLAKKEIIITDSYADKYLLSILKDITVKITIITSSTSYLSKEKIPDNINIIHKKIHGRYIFIDDKLVYALDNSFNNIGKEKFIIMRLEDITKEMLLKDII